MNRSSRGTRRLLAVLLAVAFVLVSIDARNGRLPFGVLRSAVGAVVDPVASALGTVIRPVGDRVSLLVRGRPSAGTLTALREENLRLQLQLTQARAQAGDRAADAALAGATGAGYRLRAAHVTAVGAALGQDWTALLDVGSSAGVTRDEAVLDRHGLVGRVLAVTPGTATVLLLRDARCIVGTRAGAAGEIGSVRGDGSGPLRLTVLNPDAVLHRGDPVTTLGSLGGRPYPPGVLIGTVLSAGRSPDGLTLSATVAPAASLTALDIVGVVLPQGSAPGAAPGA